MRILHVFTRFNAGGPARQALDLLPHLERLGTENHLATGAVAPDEVDWAERVEALGIPVHRVTGLGKGEPFRAGLHDLRRLVRRLRPQVVHSNMARAGVLGRIAAWRQRVPVRVHTFHGHLFHGYFNPRKARVIRWVERGLGWISTGLTTVAPAVKADLERLRVVSPGRLVVLPPALDPAPFAQAKSLPAGPPVVGWAGRLVPIKDPDLFGRLAPELPGVRLEAAGGGSLLTALREAHPGVDWLGHREEMASWYGRARVLVQTSHNEGLPLTLLEAAAAGIPVVATPAGGVGDLVEDGVSGLLVPSRHPADLAAAVRCLLADPERAGRLVEGARARLREHHPERIAAQTLTYYQALLTGCE